MWLVRKKIKTRFDSIKTRLGSVREQPYLWVYFELWLTSLVSKRKYYIMNKN